MVGFQIVVRALLIQRDSLLVSRWKDSYCFPVGGRLERGEPIEQALRREFREETGAEIVGARLVYFHENVYRLSGGALVHEFGWYFHVESDHPVGSPGDVAEHPDSPRLTLEYVPLARLGEASLMPEFLAHELPADHASGFSNAPRHFVSLQGSNGQALTTAVSW
jgi:ADP-ribose pyrophosphatase YjhB (NUDIX family)